MNETYYGDNWDITYDPQLKGDAIMIDPANEGAVYLTKEDLEEMLALL